MLKYFNTIKTQMGFMFGLIICFSGYGLWLVSKSTEELTMATENAYWEAYVPPSN